MATRFGGKNARPEHNALLGSKGHAGVSQGQPEVKLLRNAIWPPKLVKNTALLWDFQILFVRNAIYDMLL